MDLQQIIDNPRYTINALSETIENIPNLYLMLGQMGLFSQKNIDTTFVPIERRNGQLNILPTTQRGGPSTRARSDSRDKILLDTFYIGHGDDLRASDLQNLPMFGTSDFFERFDDKLLEKLSNIKMKHAQTREWWRWGALNGQILDADGSTVLLDLYDKLGGTRPEFDLKLDVTSSDGVLQFGKDIRRHMEREAKGEPVRGVLALLSSDLMDKVTTHPTIVDLYKRQGHLTVRPNPTIDDVYTGFVHGGVTYIEHNGTATYVDPETKQETVHDFIAPGEGIAVPLGTNDVFKEYFAPAERMDAVNLPGRPIYIDMKEMDWGRGIEIESESAPLTLVKKPLLVSSIVTS